MYKKKQRAIPFSLFKDAAEKCYLRKKQVAKYNLSSYKSPDEE